MDEEFNFASQIVNGRDLSEPEPESIAAAVMQEQRREQEIQQRLTEMRARKIDPAKQAEAIRLSQEHGLPVDMAYRNADKLRKPKPIDWKGLTEKAPAFTKTLQDPNYSPVMQSDVAGMPEVEKAFRGFGKQVTESFEGIELADLGRKWMDGKATPDDRKQIREIQAQQKQRPTYSDSLVARTPGIIAGAGISMGTTLVRTWDEILLGAGAGAGIGAAGGAAGLTVFGPVGTATGFVGGGGVGLVTGAGVGANVGFVKESYDLLRGEIFLQALTALDENSNELGGDTARGIAMFAGGTGALLERLGAGAISKAVPGLDKIMGQGVSSLIRIAGSNIAARKAFARLGKIAQAGVTEGATELGQAVLALETIIASGGVTDEDGRDLASTRVDTYRQSLIEGAIGGAGLAAGGQGVDVSISFARRRAEAKRESLVELGDALKQSPSAKMSPEAIQKFAENLDESTGHTMSTSAEALVTLFQNEGLSADEVSQKYPELATALDDAETTGAEIPLKAETVMKLAQTDAFADFTADVRTSPDEMTFNEASKLDEDLQQSIADVEATEQTETPVSLQYQEGIRDQLVAAGQDPDVATQQAKLFASALTNLAERSGLAPQEVFNRYGVEISSGELDGKTGDTLLNQSVRNSELTIPAETPVSVVELAESPPENVDWKAEWKDLRARLQGPSMTANDGVPVRLSSSSSKLTWSRTGDTRKQVVLRNLPEVVENAVVYDPEVLDTRGRKDLAYAYAATVVTIEGQQYPVALQYLVDNQGQRTIYQLQGFEVGGAAGERSAESSSGLRPTRIPPDSSTNPDAATSEPAPERGDPETKPEATATEFTIGEIVEIFKTQGPLFQADRPVGLNQIERGSIQFSETRDRFLITLTGNANLSTFLHESGHFFLEVMQDLAARDNAIEQLTNDVAALRKWMGVKNGEKIQTKHHEKFARGFEAYLMEGKAPSNALREAFNRFKVWMVFIYKRMASLNVELTDEVRSVMDRLVASDQAIEEARIETGVSDGPLPQEQLFLNDAEYTRYTEAWTKAQEAQKQELDAKLLLEAAQEHKRAWNDELKRVTAGFRTEVEKTNGYRAWRNILDGDVKIELDSIPKDMRKLAFGLTTSDGSGLPLDVIAEGNGYDTGIDMLNDIQTARMATRNQRRTALEQMKATHGHLNPETLAREALKAVHGAPTQDVLLTEFRALAEKAGIKVHKGLSQWLAVQADNKVSTLTRRHLEPGRWRRAELKAAKESATAAAKGDVNEAALAKRRQMMAAAVYRASTNAQDRIQAIRKNMLPFTTNRRRATLGKAGEPYLDGIDEILEGISLKEITAKSIMRLDRLDTLVKEAEARDEPLNIPDRLRSQLGKKNFQDMTLEELEGVHDAVQNIWHLAKKKTELKFRQEKRQMDAALKEMKANADAALGKPGARDGFTETGKQRARNALRFGRAQLVKMEFLFGWLDGKPSGGLMHQMIYQPIADANKAEYVIMKRLNADLMDKIRTMPADQKARWSAKRTFMGENANGATVISAALNLGNEGNKTKLLKGYGWNETQLMAEINAFMTKADWDVVQLIWDQIDTLWPLVETTATKATGLPPPKVEAIPVETPHGTYQGGYYPVAYDPDRTEKQFQNTQETDGLFTNNFMKPKLSNGFTNGRVDYNAPILLNLSVLSRHLSEVVHYVTHYEAVEQANKITSQPKFRDLVTEHMGKEFYRQIKPWLQDIARAQDTPPITQFEVMSKGMKWLRAGTSIASMGYNLFTGFKQLLGVTTALDAIPPGHWVSGMQKAWLSGDMKENWKFALAESAELEPLIKNFDRDIKMINDQYQKKTTGNAKDAVIKHAFSHIGYFQLAVNVATWHGAYEQSIAAGDSHQGAVDAADAVVRKTQSSGAIKDLAAVQRGSEASRMVSMFYSWFSVLYNRLEDIARETNSVRDVPKVARRLAVLVFMSAMLEETGRRAYEAVMSSDDEDNEDELGFILSVLVKGSDMIIGTVPLMRAFAPVESSVKGFKPEITPIARVPADFTRSLNAMADWAIEGETPTRSEAKVAVKTISTITHVPASGVYRLVDEMVGEKILEAR